MVNKNLKQVIDSVYKQKENLIQQINQSADQYKNVDLQFELDTVTNEKLIKMFNEMINGIPSDKLNELKDVVVNLLGSNEDYERLLRNVKTQIKNPTLKEVCGGISHYIIVENFDGLVDKLSNLLTDETMDKIATKVKNFKPESIDNTPVYPFSQVVEKIKQGKKFNDLNAEEKTKIAKQLDEINQVVKESSKRYSAAQTDFDAKYESVTNANNAKFFKSFMEDKNNPYSKAFDYNDLGFSVKGDVADDQEKIDIVKSVSFKLSQKTQDAILKVWKKMDELNIISAGEGAESGRKIYGFQKLYDARDKLNDALKQENFDNLTNLKDEYEKQLKNIREMYKVIKTELNPTPATMPGNVQNLREDFVPAEFKNDIATNATLNGLYNAYSIVKTMNVTAEEFLSNPQKYIDQKFDEELTKFQIDKYYKGLSFNETLARVYCDRTKEGLNTHGMPRMVGTLNFCEKDAEQKKHNLFYSAVQSGKIATVFDDPQVCYNYFSKEKTKTFINLLLVNPEDRDFSKLMAYDSVTGNKLHKTKAFDLASYLKQNKIPAKAVKERIVSFLSTAYKLACESEKQYAIDDKNYNKLLEDYKKGKIKVAPKVPTSMLVSKSRFVNMVKDAQQGIIAFVMQADNVNDKDINQLIDILKNPAQALKDLNMDENCVQKLNSLNNKDRLLNEYKRQAILDSGFSIKDIRTKEKTYNKTAEEILKDANKISTKIAKLTDEKQIEDLQKQSVLKMNQLKQLQKVETERLEKEYKSGNIPAEYYQKRVENIVSLKHNNKIAIFDDGLDKNEYIKSTGLEQLTKSEINGLYKTEIERQKVEKEIFINKQFLQNNNLISTNKDALKIEVKTANFEQIDVSQIGTTQEKQREPVVVNEAKPEKTNEKSIAQSEIDPKQTVKMP